MTKGDVKEFDLGTILTITTGYSCVEDFNKIWDLVWFLYDDEYISPMGLVALKDDIKEHILNIYPELKSVRYNKTINMEGFMCINKKTFGETLPLPKIGCTLNKDKILNKKISK